MACNSCSTDTNGVPKGCKSNGSCGTGSCDKLTVFDWLANMNLPNGQSKFNISEVRFKNGRKHFFKDTKNLAVAIGDVVAVETSPGHDIGTVSLTGELVKVQMRKKSVKTDSEDVKVIYRKASQRDIDIWQTARAKEIEVQRQARLIISRLGLKMKLSDVEFQGDGNKATFYYTADERVDFRLLIKELASTFKIRIEMKQVGLRQEAARLGGIGSCGRELCCSTWLTDIRSVSTASARYQQLSLNPQKLAGQCGKLKCCLNYELDAYIDGLKDFPKADKWLKTKKGDAVFQKMDIFKRMVWYAYKDQPMQWVALTVDQANEIISENKEGNKVDSLEAFATPFDIPSKDTSFTNVVGQDSLTRLIKRKIITEEKKEITKENPHVKMRNFIGFILIIISLSACNNNHVVFDKYQSLNLQKWHKDSILKFNFEPIDTINKHIVYVNIRNNNSYVYSNLFLIVGIEFPNNYTVIDTLEYEMADADGKFLGKGMTDLKENMLEYKPGVVFPNTGNYEIHVQHAMRKGGSVEGIEELAGISDVGIRIEKMKAND